MNTASTFGTVDIHLTDGNFKDVRLGTPRSTLLGLIYEWDTTTVPNGNYSITAVATDAEGGTVVSAPVPVVVDN